MYSKFSNLSELSREDLELLCKDLAKNLILVSGTRNSFSEEVDLRNFKDFRTASIWKLHNEVAEFIRMQIPLALEREVEPEVAKALYPEAAKNLSESLQHSLGR